MDHKIWPCLALLAGIAGGAPAGAQQNPPLAACSGPEHRQFDFWVGDWTVYRTGQNADIARSRVERLFGDCVIRETWMPLQGGGGGSLNHFDTQQGRWHQTWIDSRNSRVVFEGGLVDGKMVLTGFWKNAQGPGKDGLVRMTYSRLDGGAVRQFGEISTNHGLSWVPFFDLTYRPPASGN